ncbi:3-keto-disaccharide hydrolase [Sunxiuqinia sp. A32]|uniref:3-keto-disaccharide hydrolase n=1 Tax=Sunxiuqinia sp. A32 TaxID=3461496 RepID=UPI004045B7DC
MRRLFSFLLAGTFMFAIACTSSQKKADSAPEEKSAEVEEVVADNTLTQSEKDAGWVLLFNGETPEGWRGVNKADFPGGWEVEDGTLHCKGSGQGEAGANDGGDILYDKKFSNFHLKMDWKISEGGNSGIFYLGQEVEDWPIYKTAPEMQVLDNLRHPDAMLGKDGNRQAGSLYDLIPAKPQNAKPVGEWNSIEIICYKGTVVHKQNGETVVEYHLWTDDWKALVADSKFPELNENWADVAKEGYIAVQDHGDDVWYKNIKIREL